MPLAAHSCVSSHELLFWMEKTYRIHNNILSEKVFIHAGSVPSLSLQEKAWYNHQTQELRIIHRSLTVMWCLFSWHLTSPFIPDQWHIIHFSNEVWLAQKVYEYVALMPGKEITSFNLVRDHKCCLLWSASFFRRSLRHVRSKIN